MEAEHNPEPSEPIVPDLYLTEESIALALIVDAMDVYLRFVAKGEKENS